jgi:hypothetical protein
MKFTSPPMATPRVSRQPGDDLDELLTAFYQAETPSPWPSLEMPAHVSVLPSRLAFWHRIKRSHLALAASVALLIGGSLLFAGKSPIYRLTATRELPDIGSKAKEPAFDPDKVTNKESIVVTPEGAALHLELEENRY